jgi:hypothetical protein
MRETWVWLYHRKLGMFGAGLSASGAVASSSVLRVWSMVDRTTALLEFPKPEGREWVYNPHNFRVLFLEYGVLPPPCTKS